MFCNYLLPFCGAFDFVFPLLYRSFKVLCSPIYLFSLFLPVLLVSYPRNHCKIQCHEAYTCGLLDTVFLVYIFFFFQHFENINPSPFWSARFLLRYPITLLWELLLLRFSLSVTFDSLSIVCLGVGLFGLF